MAAISPLYAQQFEHHYGTPNIDNSQWGMYTQVTAPITPPAGYVISGISRISTALQNRFMVSRTNNNGNVPFGFFNNLYTLVAAGAIRSANDAKVLELPNGIGFAVAGTCMQSNGQEYVFYVRLNPNGTPGTLVSYYNTSDQRYRVNGVRLAPNGDFVYIVGEAYTPATLRFFVIRADLNGNIAGLPRWGFTYISLGSSNYFDRGFDVVENPLIPNTTAVVGTTLDATGNTDAFFLTLDPNTGNPLPPIMNLYGTQASYDHFYSIDNSTDPAPPPPMAPFGYVVGGYTNASNSAGTNDAWVLRFDNNQAMGWSRTIDYNGWGVNNECRDVVESRNVMTGAFEYYAGGNTVMGLQGGADMVLDKLNVFGNTLWQGTYGDQNFQLLSVIDENPVNNDNSLFGETNPGLIGNSDLCIFNTNVNGKTACDFQVNYYPERDGPRLYDRRQFMIREPFVRTQGNLQISTYQDLQKCWVPPIPPVAPKSDDASIQLGVYGTGESAITLEISGAASAPAELMVTDITGRVLYQGQVMLQEGMMNLPVDLSGQVSSGIYIVTLRQGSIVTSTKVLIAK